MNDIEAAGRGERRRARIGDGWYSVVVTCDESGATIVETFPDNPAESPHKTREARALICARVSSAIEGGFDAA